MLKSPSTYYILVAIAMLEAIVITYGLVERDLNLKKIAALETDKATLITNNATLEQNLTAANTTIAALSDKLDITTEELALVEDEYRKERNRNEAFENQISDLSGTVNQLDKLSKTDEELLQKYSKVYFLNEHYIPEKVVAIEKEYLYNEDTPKFVHAKVEPFLYDMLTAAEADDIDLWVVSAYRSFDEQAQLKGQYTVTYGSGANTFSADQGYSEHQLGTTIDFTTTGINGGLEGFGNTAAYEWLQANAHKYGFTLSYPADNQYYVYEPWHWRFVGRELAKDLHRDDAHFYDWDQRKLNEYLISIFD